MESRCLAWRTRLQAEFIVRSSADAFHNLPGEPTSDYGEFFCKGMSK